MYIKVVYGVWRSEAVEAASRSSSTRPDPIPTKLPPRSPERPITHPQVYTGPRPMAAIPAHGISFTAWRQTGFVRTTDIHIRQGQDKATLLIGIQIIMVLFVRCPTYIDNP